MDSSLTTPHSFGRPALDSRYSIRFSGTHLSRQGSALLQQQDLANNGASDTPHLFGVSANANPLEKFEKPNADVPSTLATFFIVSDLHCIGDDRSEYARESLIRIPQRDGRN